MTNAELSQRITKLIASISAFPDIALQAQNEAERLIFRLDLKHPLTFPAAIRIVSENTTLAELKLVTATAHQLVQRLHKEPCRAAQPPETRSEAQDVSARAA